MDGVPGAAGQSTWATLHTLRPRCARCRAFVSPTTGVCHNPQCPHIGQRTDPQASLVVERTRVASRQGTSWMQALLDALAKSNGVEAIGFDLDATLAKKWKAEWLDGAPEMVQRLAEQGRRVVVATNQGGVACGAAGWGEQYPSPADVVSRFEALEADLPDGVDVEWCVSIYYPDTLEEKDLQSVAQRIEALGEDVGLEIRCYSEEAARKPEAAMLQDCDVFIGDRDSDVEAARKAGVPGLQISEPV